MAARARGSCASRSAFARTAPSSIASTKSPGASNRHACGTVATSTSTRPAVDSAARMRAGSLNWKKSGPCGSPTSRRPCSRTEPEAVVGFGPLPRARGEAPARREHAHHLREGDSGIGEVDQAVAAQHGFEAGVWIGQRLRIPLTERRTGDVPHGRRHHRLREVEAGDRGSSLEGGGREDAVAGAHIEDAVPAHHAPCLQHGRHGLSGEAGEGTLVAVDLAAPAEAFEGGERLRLPRAFHRHRLLSGNERRATLAEGSWFAIFDLVNYLDDYGIYSRRTSRRDGHGPERARRARR